MAAALACGDGAVISHRSAAELWGLLKSRDESVDVSRPHAGGRRRRPGIRLRRCQSLTQGHTTLRMGIPVTTPVRTVVDLRRAASEKEVRRAIRQAGVLGLPLGHEVERDRTRSDLERDFTRLCQRCRLPPPEVNVRVGPHLVDFLWRDAHLVVETDGYRYHRGRQAFEDDRGRDLDLRARGYDVLRLSYRQVTEEPERVAAAVGDALRLAAETRTVP
jgi:very-short-patch-repair endonuclease